MKKLKFFFLGFELIFLIKIKLNQVKPIGLVFQLDSF